MGLANGHLRGKVPGAGAGCLASGCRKRLIRLCTALLRFTIGHRKYRATALPTNFRKRACEVFCRLSFVSNFPLSFQGGANALWSGTWIILQLITAAAGSPVTYRRFTSTTFFWWSCNGSPNLMIGNFNIQTFHEETKEPSLMTP